MLQEWKDEQRSAAPKLRHQPPANAVLGVGHNPSSSPDQLHRCLRGYGDSGASHSSLRLAHESGSLPNSAAGHARSRRYSSRLELARNLLRREFGSDLLAGISIVTSVLLGEYLAGSIVVLMLSGGEALENYAVRNASSVLRALAKRMPSVAHRKRDSAISDVALDDIAVGDTLVVYPHDICPVDGTVIEGNGVMNEAFLTGEPFEITKAPGSAVISGAVNGESALTITATRRAVDSRYAKIMEVMRESEQNQPHLRRLGDQLGAIYTPVAVAIAVLAWAVSGEAVRFLAVLVVATPCPLLIAIPVAIIGSISLAARRSIIVKNPAALEQIAECRTAIFDKTGTLTYGEPKLTEQLIAPGFAQKEVLALAASLELYSKHPLARAILAAAKEEGLHLQQASHVSEPPGQGLRGTVAGHQIQITSRGKLLSQKIPAPSTFRRSPVDLNASSCSTASSPRPSDCAMRREPKGIPLFSISDRSISSNAS